MIHCTFAFAIDEYTIAKSIPWSKDSMIYILIPVGYGYLRKFMGHKFVVEHDLGHLMQ